MVRGRFGGSVPTPAKVSGPGPSPMEGPTGCLGQQVSTHDSAWLTMHSRATCHGGPPFTALLTSGTMGPTPLETRNMEQLFPKPGGSTKHKGSVTPSPNAIIPPQVSQRPSWAECWGTEVPSPCRHCPISSRPTSAAHRPPAVASPPPWQ